MSDKTSQEKLKKELCDILVHVGTLKFGVFTLADGKLSPYYVDLRIIPSFPDTFAKIEELYHQVAEHDIDLNEVKRIAGIPTAGIPFAAVLAFLTKKPFLYVRKEATHGRTRKVEGILNPGDKVLLIDDLVSTGNTILSAAEAIRSEGGIVEDALVLIDRQEGGQKALNAQDIQLHCLIRMSEAAKILYDTGAIDKQQYSYILKQIKS